MNIFAITKGILHNYPCFYDYPTNNFPQVIEQLQIYVQSWLLQGYICLVKSELIKRLKDRHHQGEPLVTEEDVESVADMLVESVLHSSQFAD
ncbi:hypothetical protein HKBW3C_00066 [Candidatus Hakubella thermalkaliphila]|nr:hypothetical protein HKBW3C_00066 [Candidatus Hakubella thermalkaliphila]